MYKNKIKGRVYTEEKGKTTKNNHNNRKKQVFFGE